MQHPATLRKVTLHHGNFSRFLNCINDTKSRKASHINRDNKAQTKYLACRYLKIITTTRQIRKYFSSITKSQKLWKKLLKFQEQ